MMSDHLYQHLKVGHDSLKTRSYATKGSPMENKREYSYFEAAIWGQIDYRATGKVPQEMGP